MKKILLMCACAAIGLAACEQQNAQTSAQNTPGATQAQAPAMEPASGSNASGAPNTSPGNAGSAIVGGAMVNTPVPGDTPAMQNTPAPSVTQATHQAGAAASTCGADQAWVGQNIKSIDLSKITGVIRTYYPGDALTMDYSDQRLNIMLERGTDKVLEAKCG